MLSTIPIKICYSIITFQLPFHVFGLAMAIACRPKLLIADEPTTALDVTIQAQVLDLMQELKEKLDTSTILITHDLGIVAETCDQVAIMYAGEIIEIGLAEDIFEAEDHHLSLIHI